jgi:ubiquinone/menaquinone biosynthesis C-methylase UbiE
LSWYSEVIFPRLCDWLLDRPLLAAYRREQLAEVSGEVLEIGIGTGLNLAHYPPHVRRITSVDPSPGMNQLLRRRARRAGRDIDQRIGVAERLPLEDKSFDFAVSTLTLCSVASVEQVLREVYRVLKPGGRFVFFEHGLSPDPAVSKWQRRLNRLQGIIGAGCRLDVDVRGVLEASPFGRPRVESFYLNGVPRTHGYVYRGQATK